MSRRHQADSPVASRAPRAGALLCGSRLSSGQMVGRVQSRQKQRLRDIPVKVLP